MPGDDTKDPDVGADESADPMSEDEYREGHEYVACDECDSHNEIDPDIRKDEFADRDDLEGMFWSVTCDNDECEADLSPWVYNPNFRSATEGTTMTSTTSDAYNAGTPLAVAPYTMHLWACPDCKKQIGQGSTPDSGERCTPCLRARVSALETDRDDAPRRGDEDLREATDAPVFIIQRRRLCVTEHAPYEWDSDREIFVDGDGADTSDEKLVALGHAHWEWDAHATAFTREEGQRYADGRSYDGPFRVYSVHAIGDLRKLLRASTDYEPPTGGEGDKKNAG